MKKLTKEQQRILDKCEEWRDGSELAQRAYEKTKLYTATIASGAMKNAYQNIIDFIKNESK